MNFNEEDVRENPNTILINRNSVIPALIFAAINIVLAVMGFSEHNNIGALANAVTGWFCLALLCGWILLGKGHTPDDVRERKMYEELKAKFEE
jgi:hypothetical protein